MSESPPIQSVVANALIGSGSKQTAPPKKDRVPADPANHNPAKTRGIAARQTRRDYRTVDKAKAWRGQQRQRGARR